MKIFRLSSSLAKDEILEKCKKSGFTAVSPKIVDSQEQIELAHLLAKRSFRNKTNLAKNFGLEFLLWLSGENDIRQALEKNVFGNADFMLVSFKKTGKKTVLNWLKAKEKHLDLKKKASSLELEKISLGRIL